MDDDRAVRAVEGLRSDVAVLNERSVNMDKRLDRMNEKIVQLQDKVATLCRQNGNKLVIPTFISSSFAGITAIVIALMELLG